jgi:hypothetical protein
MDDSFKFSQVTKTLLSILEDEVTAYPDEEPLLQIIQLEDLDKNLFKDDTIETLKR